MVEIKNAAIMCAENSSLGLLNEYVCVLQAKGKLVRSTAVCEESLSTEENSKVRIVFLFSL